MTRIYSHTDIGAAALNQEFQTQLYNGKQVSYTCDHPEKLVVNMPFVGRDRQTKKRTNHDGWLRNKNYYYQALAAEHPEVFSKANLQLIEQGRTPKCDQHFIDHFPQYAAFKGQPFQHHHIGRDGQAIMLPPDLHQAPHGGIDIHNAEREIGVERNAHAFSLKVQEMQRQGKKFSWDQAAEIMKTVREELKRNPEKYNETVPLSPFIGAREKTARLGRDRQGIRQDARERDQQGSSRRERAAERLKNSKRRDRGNRGRER